MFSITALSTMRMFIGASLLVSPEYTGAAFMLPYSAPAALPSRMTGVRDFVLGALLYSAGKSKPAAPTAKADKEPTEQDALLNGGVKKSLAPPFSTDGLRRILLTNILVDAGDVISALWCYAEGSLPLEGLMTGGGGALLFVLLGLYSWMKLPA